MARHVRAITFQMGGVAVSDTMLCALFSPPSTDFERRRQACDSNPNPN